MSSFYLLDPSSTLVTNILTKTGSKLSVGNPYLPSPPNTLGTNYALNVQGATCSNNVSAFQIPADSSANRPAGQPGYIRYNTESYSVEYWNTQSNSWVSLSPLSTISPVITSISPSYVPEDSSTNYTITGSNFNSSSSVSFIGAVDGINYLPYGGATTLLSSTSLQARNTLTMSDASINATGVNGAFFVKVVNSNTGLSTTSATPLLSFNTGPIWNTAANANIGTGVTSQLYTTSTTPFTALSASDIHTPIGYSFVVAPTTGTTVLLDASSALYAGKLYGQMPTTINNTITYPFTAQAQDSSGALSVVRTFNFTVAPTSYFLTPPSGSASNGLFTPAGIQPYGAASTPFQIAYVGGATTTGFNFSLYFNTDVSLNILLKGADGAGSLFGYGGGGGWAFGRFGFAKDASYTLLIGGGGAVLGPGAGPGPYVNGGGGIAGTQGYGAQGGGYTGLFTRSSTFGNALLVASGGGGGAYESYFYTANLSSGAGTVITTYTNGGSGGDTSGNDGLSSNVLTNPQGQNSTAGTPGNGGGGGGLGGTQVAGGAGGNSGYGAGATGNPGGQLFGGSPGASGNGGGGGAGGSGYYGGGSGSGTDNVGSSGGGGSSYVSNSVVSSGFSIGGITTTLLSTAGSNGFANFYYSLNSTVTVTGSGLPSPTTPNGTLCYVFTGGVDGTPGPGTTTSYTFTINQPVVMGYLCVAGGGGGGGNGGGGGGAGGLLQGTTYVAAGTTINIQVGAGGAGGTNPTGYNGTAGSNGSNSSISGGITATILSIGGGGGGANGSAASLANSGGSGGGGGSAGGGPGNYSYAGNIGTNPNIGTVGQGYAGGFGCHISSVLLGGGGGGGAGGPGSNLGPTSYDGTSVVASSGGNGGKGITSYITGSPVGYAGGGGGAMNSNSSYGVTSGYGGCAGTLLTNGPNQFGGGNGGGGGFSGSGGVFKTVSSGTNGTGGGGGGGEHPTVGTNGGAGGSGVVIIRIPQIW